ncbi:MAG: SUMF1/EgtB/PvdO family nonheme iron enzyme [bacterium]
MIGNVWEWVQDAYRKDISRNTTGAPVRAPLRATSRTPFAGDRVMRGCGWGNDVANCRAANRLAAEPAYRSRHVGFRPARTRPSSP